MPSQLTMDALPKEGECLGDHGNAINAGPDYRIDPETGCWEWLKFKHKGYGKCSRNGKSEVAHRVYYEIASGQSLKGLHLHHKCKNPGCVNPLHMEVLTDRQHFLFHKLVEKTGLTLDDIRAIRRLSAVEGMTAARVAEQYGIHEITVYNYWGQEQVWADLLGPEEPPVEKPTRTCKECGGTFNDRLRNAIYCSIPCRVKWNQRRSYELVKARRAA